jgi:outer membrane biosynthesis protein TonB
MLKNLFGKKNDGFYMQIDESQPTPAQPVAKVEPAATQKAAPAPVEKKAEPAKEMVVVAEGAAETSAPEAKAKSSKTSVKDKKNKEDKKAEDKSAAKTTETVAPVAATMLPVMTNFATDYLIKPSSTSGRRRPGANMKSFVTMARDVKK